MKQAALEVLGHGVVPPSPKSAREAENPTVLYIVAYVISAVLTAWIEETAEDSFADIFARRKFGIAIAATIRMIATTTNSSIKLNPRADPLFSVSMSNCTLKSSN